MTEREILQDHNDPLFREGINYIDEPLENMGKIVDGRLNLGNGNWQMKKHKLSDEY